MSRRINVNRKQASASAQWKQYALRYYHLTKGKYVPKCWSLKKLHDAVDELEAANLKIFVRGKYYDVSKSTKWNLRLSAKILKIWLAIKYTFFHKI